MRASMYFTYGKEARASLRSSTTFEAILAGERTSTTRFACWPSHDRWKGVKAGDRITFFEDKEMRGRSVDVVATHDPVEIDLANCDDAVLEAWSLAEGWDPSAGRAFGRKNGRGLWIRYRIA